VIKIFKKFIPESIQFSFGLLDSKARTKLIFSGILLSLIGLLDLFAVGMLAVIASVALSAINNQPIGTLVSNILNFLSLTDINVQFQVITLTAFMVVLFISRTIFSVHFNSKIYRFLAFQNNLLTKKILTNLLDQDLQNLRNLTSQEILFAITTGLNATVVNLNGLVVTTTADLFLSAVMISTLIVFNPLVSLASITILALLSVFLYQIFNKRIREISFMNTEASISSYTKILEVLDTYRESLVRDTRNNYIEIITNLRSKVSESTAAQQILPNITKYTMELTLIIGGIVISGVMFFMFDANKALTGLSLFIGVGSRISPAFLRVQQNYLGFRMNQTSTEVTKRLLSNIKVNRIIDNKPQLDLKSKFDANIVIDKLNFKYDLSKSFGLKDLNLQITSGSFIAIVGGSGSGKTTLVDLILGLLTPSSGSIHISGKSPLTVHKQWPGAIAYVPQDVVIVNDTFTKNITLGFDPESIDHAQVSKCIKLAHLATVVNALPKKLDEPLGEKGSKLSGGQRQRVGIARALYTNPRILVLDEATSALDGESEKEINDSLQELKGEITIVVISHRLSSVVKADQVVYIEDGKIAAVGTFAEVREISSNFNSQAILMGL